jgi:hypothetical protein
MIDERSGEFTAIVCRSASSGSRVFSIAIVILRAVGCCIICRTSDRWIDAHCDP